MKPVETPKRGFSPPNPVPQGRRFYARLHSFDFACPRCDRVYCIRFLRNRAHKKGWQPRYQRWECDDCKLTLCFGLLAWLPPVGGVKAPLDIIPQNDNERDQLSRWLRGFTLGARRKENVNAITGEDPLEATRQVIEQVLGGRKYNPSTRLPMDAVEERKAKRMMPWLYD